jgi:FixJ family two-component response regulator
MDDFLSKPVRMEEMRAVVERWCPQDGAAGDASEAERGSERT